MNKPNYKIEITRIDGVISITGYCEVGTTERGILMGEKYTRVRWSQDGAQNLTTPNNALHMVTEFLKGDE
jgi:hypothetical protein